MNPAVAALIVVSDEATITTAKPAGSTSAPGSLRPATCSSRSPQPSESPQSRSGNATQATKSGIAGPSDARTGQAQEAGLTRCAATIARAAAPDGSNTSTCSATPGKAT